MHDRELAKEALASSRGRRDEPALQRRPRPRAGARRTWTTYNFAALWTAWPIASRHISWPAAAGQRRRGDELVASAAHDRHRQHHRARADLTEPDPARSTAGPPGARARLLRHDRANIPQCCGRSSRAVVRHQRVHRRRGGEDLHQRDLRASPRVGRWRADHGPELPSAIKFIASGCSNRHHPARNERRARVRELGGADLLVMALALLIWVVGKAGGVGPMLDQPPSSRAWASSGRCHPSLTGMIAFWATLSLNIPTSPLWQSQKEQMPARPSASDARRSPSPRWR